MAVILLPTNWVGGICEDRHLRSAPNGPYRSVRHSFCTKSLGYILRAYS